LEGDRAGAQTGSLQVLRQRASLGGGWGWPAGSTAAGCADQRSLEADHEFSGSVKIETLLNLPQVLLFQLLKKSLSEATDPV
jgi:hypothetical protein